MAKVPVSLAPVCKIKFNKKNELEIENYGQEAVPTGKCVSTEIGGRCC